MIGEGYSFLIEISEAGPRCRDVDIWNQPSEPPSYDSRMPILVPSMVARGHGFIYTLFDIGNQKKVGLTSLLNVDQHTIVIALS